MKRQRRMTRLPVDLWVSGVSPFLNVVERRILCSTCRAMHARRSFFLSSHLDPRQQTQMDDKVWYQKILMAIELRQPVRVLDALIWRSGVPLTQERLQNVASMVLGRPHSSLHYYDARSLIEAGLDLSVLTNWITFAPDYRKWFTFFDAAYHADPMFVRSVVCQKWFSFFVRELLLVPSMMNCFSWFQQLWIGHCAKVFARLTMQVIESIHTTTSTKTDHFLWVSNEVFRLCGCLT